MMTNTYPAIMFLQHRMFSESKYIYVLLKEVNSPNCPQIHPIEDFGGMLNQKVSFDNFILYVTNFRKTFIV